jgi:hypothetical protein
MAPSIATTTQVPRAELVRFLRPRHRGLLSTVRTDGRPQLSPVTCGVERWGPIATGGFPARLVPDA